MRRSWMAVILVLGLVAACSADPESITPLDDGQASNGDTAENSDAAENIDAVEAAAGFTILGSLEQIPASAAVDASSTLQVVAADLEAAGEQAGLSRPTNTRNRDQLVAFFGPLTGLQRDEIPLRMFVPLPQMFAERGIGDVDQFVDELGFSIGDVTSFAALEAPPAQFIVATGVSAPINLPEVVPGVLTIGENDDFVQDLQERTAARPLGRPLRLAEQDDRVAFSLATVPIIDWLTGPAAGTLADDPALAAMAERLDEEQVVSAALFAFGDEAYRGVGLGWAADQAGALGVIVLSYDTAELAEQQRPFIEGGFSGDSFASGQPISEMVTIDSLDVRGAEIVVVVRFPNDRSPNTIWNMLLQRDGPFAQPS